MRGAWLDEAAREVQAPSLLLMGAVLETRTPVTEYMPRARGTALGARIPFAEFATSLTETARGARVPVDGSAL